jgi:hypothetical protein
VALVSSAALLATSIAGCLSLSGWDYANAVFWTCFAVSALPVSVRLAWPSVSRIERILLLNILSFSFYLTSIIASPRGFYSHDEYLHWSTTIDILNRHHLFTVNSLLPVSPSYPALEIVTSALIQFTGINFYFGAILLVGILHVVLTCLIFLVFESIVMSSYVGALAALIYVGNSNFYTFLAMFSYETIAINFFFAGIFTAVLIARKDRVEPWKLVCVGVPILVGLAVSHHLSSWVGAAVLCAAGVVTFVRGDRSTAYATAALSVLAILALILWRLVSGGVVDDYVGNIVGQSVDTFAGYLSGTRAGRTFFVSGSGETQPAAYRAAAILSVVLASAGLVVGFFRSLGLRGQLSAAVPNRGQVRLGMRDNAWAIVFTLSSFAFPLSIGLRLTGGGWELGNRMSAFAYLGVGLVVAVGVAEALLTPSQGRLRAGLLGLCLAVIIAGGVIASLPPDLVLRPYRPASDGASIEPMGIAAANWTREWLGEGWRFASDRVNRLLLGTYGVQRVVTELQDKVGLGNVLFDPTVSEEDYRSIRRANLDFLLVDLRLQHGRPRFGFYFQGGEDPGLHASAPLVPDLLKFDNISRVGRIFDNGYEVIYDVRNLLEVRPPSSLPALDETHSRIDAAAEVTKSHRYNEGVDSAVNAGGSGQAISANDKGALRHAPR